MRISLAILSIVSVHGSTTCDSLKTAYTLTQCCGDDVAGNSSAVCPSGCTTTPAAPFDIAGYYQADLDAYTFVYVSSDLKWTLFSNSGTGYFSLPILRQLQLKNPLSNDAESVTYSSDRDGPKPFLETAQGPGWTETKIEEISFTLTGFESIRVTGKINNASTTLGPFLYGSHWPNVVAAAAPAHTNRQLTYIFYKDPPWTGYTKLEPSAAMIAAVASLD